MRSSTPAVEVHLSHRSNWLRIVGHPAPIRVRDDALSILTAGRHLHARVGSPLMDDETARRIGQNEARFRDVNEALASSKSLLDTSRLQPFRCECGTLGCTSSSS
jgi:hypothetical protein